MATYASSTNPFIRTDPANGSLDRPAKKSAPGNAIATNSIITKDKEVDLLISNEDIESPVSKSSKLDVDILKYAENCSADILCQNSETNTQPHDSVQDTGDEVARLNQALVDSVVNLEIRELVHTATKIFSPGDTSKQAIEEEEEDVEAEVEVEADTGTVLQDSKGDSRHRQHIELIKKLRLQLRDLERYAHQRGELEQVPPSVLAERQTVIIDTIKDRLSLNINTDETEKLELDELKQQVDKELHELLDPIASKEHLLNQLKTQLVDMERYIDHLHGTLGKIADKKACMCHLHGCSHEAPDKSQEALVQSKSPRGLLETASLMNNEAIPKTSRLIRSLVTQLICSDLKLQESAKKEKQIFENDRASNSLFEAPTTKGLQLHDGAAWSLHLDKVILATDSLVNLFTLEGLTTTKPPEEGLVESIVWLQLGPAIRDLLSYGLIDPNSIPNSTSYASLLFNPYYLLSSLTCFPSSQQPPTSCGDKVHVWNVINEYYGCRSETEFKTSSVKTLSLSFDLAPSVNGPVKITSKQALLIAVEDIKETLAKARPNGPESHFKAFIYTALNKSRLQTWLRLVFKNKSILRRFYHSFSFVNQPDKMDKFLATIGPLSQFEFKLRTSVESIEQFVNAF